MAIEIVDFPIKNGGSFHSYVKLPDGNKYHDLFYGSLVHHCLNMFEPFLHVHLPG